MDTRQLERLCGSFRRKLRALVMRAGVCRLLALGLVSLPPLLALDWWVHLGSAWRLLILLVYLAGLAATGWWTLLAPLRRRWSNEEVLSYLDSVLPAGQGMLLELYQLIRGEAIQEIKSPLGREMAEGAVRGLAPLVDAAARNRTLHRRRALFWAKLAAAAVTLCLGAGLALHLTGESYAAIGLERFFNPFSSRRWPHRTNIELAKPPNGWTIPQMESFEVRGKVTGSLVPPQVTLAYRGRSGGYWIKEKVTVRDDGSIRYTFPEVREEIRFYLFGGDYETGEKTISIVERPFLKSILADYDYPGYAGIPDRKVEGGQLIGLEGTKVRLSFESSMALKKAVFVLREGKAEEKREELKLSSPTRFEKELYLSEDGSYAVELYEVNGFREAKPERYEMRVTPDDPPEVELLSPGRNLTNTNEATVEVALRAQDDFGLRKIEFLHAVDEAKPAPLTDRITGPLTVKGKTKEARFTWDLRRMKLPKTGVLRYFVRVQDVNPTGKGVAETAPLEIKLVKRSQFHFSIFEQAKRIEAEARIAWENQYVAWELGRQWPKKGSGKEDDPVWSEMREKQDLAVRASRVMENYLLDLTEQYEKNDMSRDFMAGRLAVIAELLRRVTRTEHPAIVRGLRAARPKTDADAVPARLKGLRASALGKFTANQKMATLHLERLVKRLFDWRDLQTTLIRTTLLHEEQGEVLGLTEKLAPKTLGMELEDLPDDVQDRLITLGKRQRTLFDVESELEKELEFQIYRAEQQKRRSILEALRTAYQGLRGKRVNDNLKVAAKKIENNQAFQIVENQKAALQILNVVKGGLIHAGQKVDPEPKITLAMVPSKIIEVRPKPEPEGGTKPEPTDVASVDNVEVLTPEELLANLPVGSDPVTIAINVAWEAQDAVHARTNYLAENSGPGEMPRYVRMKGGILLGKQDGALRVLDLAIGASEKAGPSPVGNSLKGVKGEFEQSRELIKRRLLGKGVQQLQADSMDSLDDLRRRYIPLGKSVAEAVEENRKRKGRDAFNRQFLLRDKDLDRAVAVIDRLNHLQLLERDVLRKLKRFSEHPAKDPGWAGMEKTNRERATAAHEKAVGLLAEVGKEFGGLSGEIASRVGEAGIGSLLELKPAGWAAGIRAGGKDHDLVESVSAAAGLLERTLTALKDLLGERVKPKIAATQEDEKPQEITLEEWEKMRSPEALRERIKNARGLPPEVREIMLRALSKEFPEKYRELLVDYYASFISAGAKKETGVGGSGAEGGAK